MEIREIDLELNSVYRNLSSCYEAEFSAITGTLPLECGSYRVQTALFDDSGIETRFRGFIAYESTVPIAFAVVGAFEDRYDVAEFYVVPSKRRSGVGKRLAEHLFSIFPGECQARQIEGADAAKAFCRKMVSTLTKGRFYEQNVDDPLWGCIDLLEAA